MAQNVSNHVRVHALYHYVVIPVTLLLIILSAINFFTSSTLTNAIIVGITVMLHVAVFLVRDYAKKNQDRIIRVEMRLRYYQLTQRRLEEDGRDLSTAQVVALRFASDEELVEMMTNSATRAKTPLQIKQQILRWNPDTMRV